MPRIRVSRGAIGRGVRWAAGACPVQGSLVAALGKGAQAAIAGGAVAAAAATGAAAIGGALNGEDKDK